MKKELLTPGYRMRYILYLPQRRALFLHIPRTGGTWVKDSVRLMEIEREKWWGVCLENRPHKHALLPYILPEHLAKVDFVFTFVRHPSSYYKSVWRASTRIVCNHLFGVEKKRGLQKGELRNRWEEYGHDSVITESVDVWKSSYPSNETVIRWKPDFEEWMEDMLREEPGWVTRWFERFVGPDGGEFPHFIGRTETLEQDVGRLMSSLGYEKEWEESLPTIRKNVVALNGVGQRKAPHVEMSEEMVERVRRSERVHLRRFYGEDTINRRVYRDIQGVPIS